jgi:purine-nucleoside/S-methyl-5'-thioadenosine phosphorylase / adenosine deaminase
MVFSVPQTEPCNLRPQIRLSDCRLNFKRPGHAKGKGSVCYIENLDKRNFKIVLRGGMKWLECADLTRQPWVLHAFSTRAGGGSRAPASGLNLGFTPRDARARVRDNRKSFFSALGASQYPLAEVRQIHSALVYRVRRAGRGKLQYLPCGASAHSITGQPAPQGDALITDEPGILLPVRTADCVPILLMDPERRVVAAIHAGWKGMLGCIAEKAVGEMRRGFDSRPGAILAAIGPCIRACCYEVGEDLAGAFCGRFTEGERFVLRPPEDKPGRDPYPPPFLSLAPPGHGSDGAPRPHLDLVAAAQYQLRRAGLLPRHVHLADFCTACQTDLFFSHRKEGSHTGRMMAVIGIRPPGSTGRKRPSRPARARSG